MTRAGGTGRGGRTRLDPDLLLTLAERLTARDRWLISMVHEHRVLTSRQITALAFSSERVARARLTVLHRQRVFDRVRPHAGHGRQSALGHYLLGPAGAPILAAHTGLSVGELGWRRDSAAALAHSPRLSHLVGVNAVFTALAHASRPLPASQGLTLWWSERRTAQLWGDLARPDGYGRWHDPAGGGVEFYLEYDTGTETLDRVTAKLHGYTALATARARPVLLLFWLPNPARETHLRRQLTDPARWTPQIQIATATPAATATSGQTGPAAAVWQPLTGTGRLALADLPAALNLPAPAPMPATWDADDVLLGAPFPRPPDPPAGRR
ncbi:replication-relaxation family protein [Frankia sp. CiP3]|uniref:replication-relaxation family protein n=1 Tax=Frankia sp. CiP3 TaxID=2880971 RepID=UPI001EF4033C|nr:replication-relaxation family protein [Frankia sp. CiP3]